MNQPSDWHIQETYKSMMTYGQGMLRYTFLINGASVISLMTFLGNLQGKGHAFPNLRAAFIFFIAGILLSGFASISTYIVQLMLFNESNVSSEPTGTKSHVFWLYVTLALILLSITCFAAGAFHAMVHLT